MTDNNIQNPFKNPSPLAIGDIFSVPDLKNISYTSFDFYSIKARVIEYIKKYFPDDFNDFVESDLGIMLIETWAYMADLISFKLDLYANEMFIDTVSQPKNLQRLAKLVGYPIRPPRAATTRMALTLSGPYTFDVQMDGGYFISVPSRDGNILGYELYPADEEWNPILDDNITIPAGSVSNLSVVAVEGFSTQTVRTSDGVKFQTYQVDNDSVLEGSIRVYVNNNQWKQVDFFSENDNGPYYRVEYDENYRATIIFSDDIKGKIPSQGSEIRIEYRYGGGPRGNITVGYINQIANVTSNLIPGAIPVNINNYTQGEGGEDAESIDEVKTRLPLWIKAQNRAVTGEDYSFLSESYSTLYHGRIGKSKAILRNSGCSGNIVDIYVLQLDANSTLKTANSTLKRELKNFLLDRKMLTDFVCIKDAAQVFQNININILINKFYYEFKKDVYDRVVAQVNSFFALEKWNIGQPLKKQDLVQWLNAISNVSSVEVDFANNNQNLAAGTDVIIVDFWKIIRPGNISINIELVN
jgi:hypothetical protein